MEITALSLVGIIVLIIVGGVAIKIGFSFDINAWIQGRLKHRKETLKILCPHTDITVKDDKSVEVQSLFTSPFGTSSWICSKCGMTTHDSDIPQRLTEHYLNNIDDYIKQLKKFNKLVKKIYKA